MLFLKLKNYAIFAEIFPPDIHICGRFITDKLGVLGMLAILERVNMLDIGDMVEIVDMNDMYDMINFLSLWK